MIEITGAHPPEHRLEVGDVIMVHRELKDKQTGKPFTWKFFALVTRAGARPGRAARMIWCVILDEKEREERQLATYDEQTTIWYLAPDEWPDGVHAFRTKLILEGKVEGMV
jgi:hypothetical protein